MSERVRRFVRTPNCDEARCEEHEARCEAVEKREAKAGECRLTAYRIKRRLFDGDRI